MIMDHCDQCFEFNSENKKKDVFKRDEMIW